MRFLASTGLTAILILTAPGQAAAQTAGNPNGDQVELTRHRDWAVQCSKGGDGADGSCFMFQRILVEESGDTLLQMVVDLPRNLAAPRAIFKSPLGTYLKPGIKIAIDSQPAIDLEIEYCDRQGCYAGKLLEPAILQSLQQGRRITVTFQNRGRQEISLPISLLGFSAALNEL